MSTSHNPEPTRSNGLRVNYLRFTCSCGFTTLTFSWYGGPEHNCSQAGQSRSEHCVRICQVPRCPEIGFENGSWCADPAHEDFVRAAYGYFPRRSGSERTAEDIRQTEAFIARQPKRI